MATFYFNYGIDHSVCLSRVESQLAIAPVDMLMSGCMRICLKICGEGMPPYFRHISEWDGGGSMKRSAYTDIIVSSVYRGCLYEQTPSTSVGILKFNSNENLCASLVN